MTLGPEEKYPADDAIDMDLSTVASTQSDGGTGWLKLELDKTYLIHKIVIYLRFYTNWFNPQNWCVKSEDNFKECAAKMNNTEVSLFQGEVKLTSCGTLQLTNGLEQKDQIYTLICNSRGDTVKLSKTEGDITVYEVAIIGTGEDILIDPCLSIGVEIKTSNNTLKIGFHHCLLIQRCRIR